jgi:HD-like signal output (HDOD) protein
VFALGLSRVRDLVYSCRLPALFADAKVGMSPVIFWRHALGTALISQHLAQVLHMENPEKMYLAGLLHDVGILVNCLLFPDDFRDVLRIATTSETPLVEIEKPLLGFTHCESGRILADLWTLPEDLSGAIEYHHVAASDVGDPVMTAIVNLADLLCRLRGLGYGYYEAREFDLAAEPAWKVLREKCQAITQLDLANFTFSLDAHAVAVRALVDNILGVASPPA